MYFNAGVIHWISLSYLDDPNSLSILLLPFFLYSLVALCLDGYVNLTFMSCKTGRSLITHLVLSCLVLSGFLIVVVGEPATLKKCCLCKLIGTEKGSTFQFNLFLLFIVHQLHERTQKVVTGSTAPWRVLSFVGTYCHLIFHAPRKF